MLRQRSFQLESAIRPNYTIFDFFLGCYFDWQVVIGAGGSRGYNQSQFQNEANIELRAKELGRLEEA